MSTLFQIKLTHLVVVLLIIKNTHFSRHTWLKVIPCKICYIFLRMREKRTHLLPHWGFCINWNRNLELLKSVTEKKIYEMYLCVAPLKWLLVFDSDDCGTSHEKYCFYFWVEKRWKSSKVHLANYFLKNKLFLSSTSLHKKRWTNV